MLEAINIRLGVTALISLALLLPSDASALTFVQILGLFHIVSGLLLTFILLTFLTGIGLYVARLNTWPSHREFAIRVLQWAVAMLFVLIILIAVVNLFQRYTGTALTILAFIIVIAVAVLIVRMAAQSKKKEAGKKKEAPAGAKK